MHITIKIITVTLQLSALSVPALSPAHGQFPPDEALRSRFFAHQVDFEKLVVMTNEDSHLVRIAPDFTWLDNDVAWPRKNVGISEQRWNNYRLLFRRVGDSDGIIKKDEPTRIIFPIVTTGLVPTGAEKGLVYSQVPLYPVLRSLDRRFPDELWDGPDRSHVLVYKPIEDHWYIFYEQW